LKLLLTGTGSSVINCNSDSSSEISVEVGSFKFNKSESSSIANLSSILFGSLRNNRTKRFSGSWEDTGCFSNSILVSLDLLSRLVEVSLGSLLPMFAQVDVDDHVIVLDHC